MVLMCQHHCMAVTRAPFSASSLSPSVSIHLLVAFFSLFFLLHVCFASFLGEVIQLFSVCAALSILCPFQWGGRRSGNAADL